MDAIFTDKEIARAAQRGVVLTADDENTIYVPVQDRRPIGTAIIVPGQYEGQQFFVVVSTDRQLVITDIQAIDAGPLDAARDDQLYAAFRGQSVEAVQAAANAEGLASAAQRAVLRAATMLQVRLKP
ncbi:MAG: hypothetical protein ABF271_01435 [Abyssibacter sp.]|uniref:hypothetical protein n=1 Tax=Abyssibacter sp. TaxID=2320200 RepID=UPI00321AF019